ncbi:unnamed protein product [Linum trigynum]|uniref:Uncharacterized protein n=1 Tax=Linum trigynum TaxID=586398 RepID=A0AAV2FAP0_9ROSI
MTMATLEEIVGVGNLDYSVAGDSWPPPLALKKTSPVARSGCRPQIDDLFQLRTTTTTTTTLLRWVVEESIFLFVGLRGKSSWMWRRMIGSGEKKKRKGKPKR